MATRAPCILYAYAAGQIDLTLMRRTKLLALLRRRFEEEEDHRPQASLLTSQRRNAGADAQRPSVRRVLSGAVNPILAQSGRSQPPSPILGISSSSSIYHHRMARISVADCVPAIPNLTLFFGPVL